MTSFMPMATSSWTEVKKSSIKWVQLGDFNGDGRADVFRATGKRWDISYSTPSGLSAWIRVKKSQTKRSGLRFGDVNGDGKDDVIWPKGRHIMVSYSAKGDWKILNNNVGLHTPGFWEKLFNSSRDSGYSGLVLVGNFDGDNKEDLFIRWKH